MGKTGQLAQSLLERAAAPGNIEAKALGRGAIDMERPDSLAKAISNERPDVVVNAAAYTAVDAAEGEEARAFAINAVGAGEAARASADAGAAFIHISTDYVFDGSGEEARDEEAPTAPLGAYGRSKLAGEELVRERHPAALIVRTAWLYSPFGHNFVRTMMTAARQREELRVVADQRGNPTSALDLADGLLATARHGWSDGATFHLAGTGVASWAEFAEAVMEECRRSNLPAARIVPIPTSEYSARARRPGNSMLDSRRFQERFGFAMPEWRCSLGAVVQRLGQG